MRTHECIDCEHVAISAFHPPCNQCFKTEERSRWKVRGEYVKNIEEMAKRIRRDNGELFRLRELIREMREAFSQVHNFIIVSRAAYPDPISTMIERQINKADAALKGEPVRYGCHVGPTSDNETNGCVIDGGDIDDCLHAIGTERKEDCPHWKPIQP